MKRVLVSALAIAASLIAATGANATTLYSSGPIDGQEDAWTIDQGFSVANSFILNSPGTAAGATFTLWNFPGDVTTNVDWAILIAEPFGGSPGDPPFSNVVASGSGTSVSQSFDFTNGFGYSVNTDTISLPNVSLAAATTYWFALYNAIVTGGDPAYWDMTQTPTTPGAWESRAGDVSYGANCQNNGGGVGVGPDNNSCSNTFTIEGSSGAPVPEPSSLSLLIAGLLGLAGLGAYRSRRNSNATA